MLLHSADLRHPSGVPEAGRSNTSPPTWPTLCHHHPAAGTARVGRRPKQPTHHLHPAPALAVVFAGSCGISVPSLAQESNLAKLCGRRVGWADLRRSTYTCPPCPLAALKRLQTDVSRHLDDLFFPSTLCTANPVGHSYHHDQAPTPKSTAQPTCEIPSAHPTFKCYAAAANRL